MKDITPFVKACRRLDLNLAQAHFLLLAPDGEFSLPKHGRSLLGKRYELHRTASQLRARRLLHLRWSQWNARDRVCKLTERGVDFCRILQQSLDECG
jgi:hypothetical protein